MLLGPALHLSPDFSSNPPKQSSQFPLPAQNHHMWIKAKLDHTHFLFFFSFHTTPFDPNAQRKKSNQSAGWVQWGCSYYAVSEYGNSLESKGLKIKKCAFFLWGLVKLKLKAESVCLCERVAATETDFFFYMYFLSPCIVLSLLWSLRRCLSQRVYEGREGKGACGGHNSRLCHMGDREREINWEE